MQARFSQSLGIELHALLIMGYTINQHDNGMVRAGINSLVLSIICIASDALA